jgi:hypothetical protein
MKFLIAFVMSALLASAVFSQDVPGELKTITLSSPYEESANGPLISGKKVDRNCFDLVSEAEVQCGKHRWDIVYGNLRVGEEWDWFMVADSRGVRTKMVGLGKKDWTDDVNVRTVQPFPKLKAGESRTVMVDASGSDGAPGADGKSAGNRSVDRSSYSLVESPSLVDSSLKPVRTSEHLVRAVEGKMYVVRVKDDQNDFYVLLRVDEIVRGRTAKLSWKRIAAPAGSVAR